MLSPIVFGCGNLGLAAKGADAEAVIGRYLELGGNTFDTAHVYCAWVPGGGGASETELGRVLRALGKLETATIVTKGGHPGMDGYPRVGPFLSRAQVRADLEDSLQRLGRDWVDLFLLHRDDGMTPPGEIAETLGELVDEGKVRAFGVSNWSIERMLALPGVAAVQLHFSLASPSWTEGPEPTVRAVRPERVAEYGVPVMAYSAMAAGFFEHGGGGYDTPLNRERKARAEALAAAKGCTTQQIALGYLLAHPGVHPILGTSKPSRVSEALGALELKMNLAEALLLRG